MAPLYNSVIYVIYVMLCLMLFTHAFFHTCWKCPERAWICFNFICLTGILMSAIAPQLSCLMFTGTNSHWTTHFENCIKYATFCHATDNAIHSVSPVDRATDHCFLDFQLIAGPLSDNKKIAWNTKPIF